MYEKYNGWSNRDTWLASLWLNNDENLYNNFVTLLQQPKGRITSTRALLKTGITYNIITDKIDLDNVNYDEVITRNE